MALRGEEVAAVEAQGREGSTKKSLPAGAWRVKRAAFDARVRLAAFLWYGYG